MGLPEWIERTGARREPGASRLFSVSDYGAVADTSVVSTAAIQQAIDAAAAAGGGVVSFGPGGYVTGALFLKTGVHLRIDPGVTLYGSRNDADYPIRPTRVAGIEMPWPAALINVEDAENVKISGGGTIDGRGEKWWDKYWDMRRNDYEPRGLRWAVDYDAERVRLVVVSNASDVTLENLHLKRSGFWTVQILYSDHVTTDGLTISDNQGPSTDGIDIDSSTWVLVQNNDIDNNDDTICLKAGRDADGLRVNRPTEYVLIRNNLTRRGGGIISFGSETSGGIRHVVAYDNRGVGTKEGIRFKSAKTRGGVVEDVIIRNTRMENVPLPITFTLNWNPSYSYATLPENQTDLPPHWIVLNTPVTPPGRGLAEFRDILIDGVTAVGAERILTVSGLPEKAIHDVTLRDIRAEGREAGFIEHARDWTIENVVLTTPSGEPVLITDSENVDAPLVKRAPAKPAVFLIGDSTVKNGSGRGEGGLWGWGDFLAPHFDTTRIAVRNRALGGRSSRTYLTEGLWDKVLAELKPGDFVLMQFGHNDGGPLNTGRARASLKGNGDSTRTVVMEATGKEETVRTYGWYLRKYIADAKAKGAVPIVLSLVPRNIWENGRVVRAAGDYGRWAAEAAGQGGACFIDFNEIVARRYESIGQERVKTDLFLEDHTHTNEAGARINAAALVEGLRGQEGCGGLAGYLAAVP